MNTRIATIIQLILNILLGSYFIYSQRTYIKDFLKKRYVTASNISQMNMAVSKQFIDTSSNRAGEAYKILVVGNSISLHAVAEDIGWFHVSGMAASSIEKDFAHLLFRKIENLYPDRNIILRVANVAGFERNFYNYKFDKLDTLTAFTPDIIVFQLGENVTLRQNEGDAELFRKKYIELINRFKTERKPIIICTTPFMPSLEKSGEIEKVANETKTFLVDLSHLSFNEQNLAVYEKGYKGNKSEWGVAGIGRHPGDHGMENIAEEIFTTIQAVIYKCQK
ncbi:MAG: hypothetical protein JWQ40_2017 [Segetibacter sp.]|nr:hypothetical protein [Segetibacter sp.]